MKGDYINYKLFAESIVENRPDIIAAYGYGSAFVHQSGYSYNTKKSLDLIFVVDDIKKWNNKNFKVNRDDYTKYSKTIFKLTPKHLLKSGTGIIYNVITNKYELDFKYGFLTAVIVLPAVVFKPVSSFATQNDI